MTNESVPVSNVSAKHRARRVPGGFHDQRLSLHHIVRIQASDHVACGSDKRVTRFAFMTNSYTVWSQ
jgi:hypothetical protein